jgi:membrane carboxypeptidase/penicillin-binding protein
VKILKVLKRRKQIRNIVVILLAVLFSAYIVYLAVGLPSLQQLENPTPELATKVYSYDGNCSVSFISSKGLIRRLIAYRRT